MSLAAATWALAAAMGATGALDLGLRTDVRGLEGGPTGVPVYEPAPYQMEATLTLSGQLDPRLTYGLSLAPRLLLLASPEVGHAVQRSAKYLSADGSLAWRAGDRTTLSLAGTGSLGTYATSPLNQLSTTSPGSGAQPGSGLMDPAAGLRAATYASNGVRVGVEWRATQTITLGGGAGESHGGGVSEADRLVFPTTDTLSANIQGTLAATPLDGLGLQAHYDLTRLEGQGQVRIFGALARWSRLLARSLDGSLGVGVASTVQSDGVSRLAPNFEASIAKAAPAVDRGLGLSAQVGYAPYVDQYASQVEQRLTARTDLEVVFDGGHRISWIASGASAVGPSVIQQRVAAMELGGWYRKTDLELGLTLRAGVQESLGPGTAIRQWSVGVVVRWRRLPTP